MTFNNIDWHKVASSDFWFAVDPAIIHPSEKAFLYIGIALVILGIIFLIYSRFANKFLANVTFRIGRILLTTGVIEGIWYVLRYENAQALGTRFTAALMLVLGLAFLYWPIKYFFTHYKLDMARAEREASRDKYLTKKR